MKSTFDIGLKISLLVLLAGSVCVTGSQNSGPAGKTKFPDQLLSIHNQKINVKKLLSKKKVVVVTLKATWCKVCQNQLYRIKQNLPEINNCGVTFLVLAPGPANDLKSIQKTVDFDFPFIEDKNLAISKSLGLNINNKEIFPSIFILNPDLTIGWLQKGRNSSWYGDKALLDEINCGDWI